MRCELLQSKDEAFGIWNEYDLRRMLLFWRRIYIFPSEGKQWDMIFRYYKIGSFGSDLESKPRNPYHEAPRRFSYANGIARSHLRKP
jgi:hypothetical protein